MGADIWQTMNLVCAKDRHSSCCNVQNSLKLLKKTNNNLNESKVNSYIQYIIISKVKYLLLTNIRVNSGHTDSFGRKIRPRI